MPTLTVGTNSWVTVAEANTYFDEKYGASAWATLGLHEKERLLISGYRWIMAQSFFSISPASTAPAVKQAQCEAAWFLYMHNEALEKRRGLYVTGVRQFDISAFSETLAEPAFPEFIKDILDHFTVGMGGTFGTASRTLDD